MLEGLVKKWVTLRCLQLEFGRSQPSLALLHWPNPPSMALSILLGSTSGSWSELGGPTDPDQTGHFGGNLGSDIESCIECKGFGTNWIP